jgi:hypothetical protein
LTVTGLLMEGLGKALSVMVGWPRCFGKHRSIAHSPAKEDNCPCHIPMV